MMLVLFTGFTALLSCDKRGSIGCNYKSVKRPIANVAHSSTKWSGKFITAIIIWTLLWVWCSSMHGFWFAMFRILSERINLKRFIPYHTQNIVSKELSVWSKLTVLLTGTMLPLCFKIVGIWFSYFSWSEEKMDHFSIHLNFFWELAKPAQIIFVSVLISKKSMRIQINATCSRKIYSVHLFCLLSHMPELKLWRYGFSIKMLHMFPTGILPKISS